MKRVLLGIAYPFVQMYLFFFPKKEFDPRFNGHIVNENDEFVDNPGEGHAIA